MVGLYVGSTKAGGWNCLIKVTWVPFPTISCKNLISADLSASRNSILIFPLLVTLRIQVTKCTSYRTGVSTEAQIFVTIAILHLQSIMSCRQWGKSVPDLHLAINNAISIFFFKVLMQEMSHKRCQTSKSSHVKEINNWDHYLRQSTIIR